MVVSFFNLIISQFHHKGPEVGYISLSVNVRVTVYTNAGIAR